MKALVALVLAASLGCVTGAFTGPNPAFEAQPESCGRLGAAAQQHWIETDAQWNTPGLFAVEDPSLPYLGAVVVLLPVALASDAVSLIGFGAAGSLALVPANYAQDVRRSECERN